MRRFSLIALVLILTLAACGGDDGDSDTVLPTRVSDAVAEETVEATVESVPDEATETATPTAIPTATPTSIPEDTATPTITRTPQPTSTFAPTETATITPTVNAGASATALLVEAPIFSTLTPIPIQPGGTQPTQIPAVAADVVITALQLQEEVGFRLEDRPEIEAFTLIFEEGEAQGVLVQMTARAGQAMATGTVFIPFDLAGDFIAISIAEIAMGSGEAPPRYQEIARDILLPAVIDAFDGILDERLGAGHDLESLTIVGNQMEIFLLVPIQ